MKKIYLCAIFLCFAAFLSAQSHFSSQSHQERVTNIAAFPSKDGFDISFLSTGDDGFLIKWTDDNIGEHYQISDVGIKMAVCSPNGRDIAVYETDGGSVNKVTVWDWAKLTKKYTKKFTDSVTSLAYSSKGTYLIIGTATVDGAVFVRTSDWATVNKIRENTSIVSYITTSATEKTAVMYSPTGFLSYFDMSTGKNKAKFSCVQGLSQVRFFNNNLFLAGVKDNNLYVIQATTGKTISSIPSSFCTLLSSEAEKYMYYLEYDGKNNYEIKMLEPLDNKTVSNPRIIKSMKGPRGDASICSGLKVNTQILLGGGKGSVYRTDSEPTTITETLQDITENIYSKIHDIENCDDSFYFLTSNAIYKSSYDSGVVTKMATTNGETNFIAYGDERVILYSKETRTPVKLVNLADKSQVELFTPKRSVQTLSVFGNNIIEIESSAYVNIYDIEKKTFKEIFSGTGIQDAVMCDDGNVYIGKSSSTNPASPLISVNPKTLETVPLQVNGNVTYALSTNGKNIYGINLQSTDTSSTTYVFSFNTSTKSTVNILKFSEEDPEAFTYLYDKYLYTNIGKNKVYSYNLNEKKRFSYDRTASMPMKVSRNAKRVLILNRDGIISWAGSTSSTLLADWYLTNDELWYEF